MATRIAEYFRDEGGDVLMMMDSVTRAAMAQREVGLSVGEPPATRGYPPSVFAMLASLLERAGPGARGSITGLYTVLVEGDDHNEPIADAARSILDGHIVLDRKLATAGHFPSIQSLDSISRVANKITTAEQKSDATELRRMMAAHRDVRELVEIGAYVPGTNPEADRATAIWPQITALPAPGPGREGHRRPRPGTPCASSSRVLTFRTPTAGATVAGRVQTLSGRAPAGRPVQ